MNAVEVLRWARDLIADPERWCQGALAENAECEPVDYDSPDACRWCALGAVYRASPKTPDGDAAIFYLHDAARPRGLIDANDNQDHAAVLDLYDRAIALAEADSPRHRRRGYSW